MKTPIAKPDSAPATDPQAAAGEPGEGAKTGRAGTIRRRVAGASAGKTQATEPATRPVVDPVERIAARVERGGKTRAERLAAKSDEAPRPRLRAVQSEPAPGAPGAKAGTGAAGLKVVAPHGGQGAKPATLGGPAGQVPPQTPPAASPQAPLAQGAAPPAAAPMPPANPPQGPKPGPAQVTSPFAGSVPPTPVKPAQPQPGAQAHPGQKMPGQQMPGQHQPGQHQPGQHQSGQHQPGQQPKPAGGPGHQQPNRPAAPAPAAKPIATVEAARMHLRHWVMVALFVLFVFAPSAIYGYYLYAIAADQYESDVGFGSRTETASTTFDVLGVLGGGGASSTKDMDILNQFVLSQELVERIDRKLDLRKIYSRHPEDWLFAFPADGPIEDLVDYWDWMVKVDYDASTGLMTLAVYAFTPEDAQAIAREIVVESTSIINELSKTAQEDTTQYSRDALAKAEDRYRKAQNELTEFRIKNRIVDPQTELAGASQVVNTLVQQLAEAQINLDLLVGTVSDSDPRITQLNRRIEVIRNRISEESAKVGNLADPADPGYASLVRDFQALQMELEFAQKSYLAAQGAYDQAVTDAQQQTHYLATFLAPTLAQSTTAPDRPLNILLTALSGLMLWASVSMIYYALRDRR